MHGPRETSYLIYGYTQIIHTTDKAILYEIDGRRWWIPKSIGLPDEEHLSVTIPDWFNLVEADDFCIEKLQNKNAKANTSLFRQELI